MTGLTRIRLVIAMGVIALHTVALWALQQGLQARTTAIAAPVSIHARLLAAAPPMAPVPIAGGLPLPMAPTPQAKAKPKPKPQPKPAPPPFATAPPANTNINTNTDTNTTTATSEPDRQIHVPAPSTPMAAGLTSDDAATGSISGAPRNASSGRATRDARADPPTGAATAALAPPVAPPELPSTAARYLHNPKPRYPPISLRLREQGTVLVKVLVNDQGLAQQAEIKASSGFQRLDAAAVAAVLTWRFVPGRHDGVPQAMWFIVPMPFVIP